MLRERKRERERESVCAYADCRERVCVCVCERERECASKNKRVCVLYRKWERKSECEKGEKKPIKRGLDHFPFRTNSEDKVIMSDISSNIFESLSTNPLFSSLHIEQHQMKRNKTNGSWKWKRQKSYFADENENVFGKIRPAQKSLNLPWKGEFGEHKPNFFCPHWCWLFCLEML